MRKHLSDRTNQTLSKSWNDFKTSSRRLKHVFPKNNQRFLKQKKPFSYVCNNTLNGSLMNRWWNKLFGGRRNSNNSNAINEQKCTTNKNKKTGTDPCFLSFVIRLVLEEASRLDHFCLLAGVDQ